MNNLVGRTHEVELIENAITALSDRKSLVMTPIVQFYGPHGMGKTTLLRTAQNRCKANNISYIWAEGSKEDTLWVSIDNQVNERLTKSPKTTAQIPQDVITNIRTLVEKEPTVLLIDGLDESGEINLEQIELMVQELIESGRLFVATSSKWLVPFEKTRNLARKLTPIALSSLDRDSCELYINSADNFDTNIREKILNWSCGYPLALNIFTKAALNNEIDFSHKNYQNKMLYVLKKKIIDEGILSDAPQELLPEFTSLLTILSIPRRFNLTFMQELIEKFAPQYKLESSIGYLSLPKKIYEITGLFNWSLTRAGFSIELPIREIFSLKLRIEDSSQFLELHQTAAKINQHFITQTTGSDRIRYLREYLYHVVHTPREFAKLNQIINNFVEPILDKEDTEIQVQFREELDQDLELKTSLGKYFKLLYNITENLINSKK